MEDLLESLIGRYNGLREELTALVETARARVMEGSEANGFTAEERTRSESLRTTMGELREQIEAERELRRTEEEEPTTVPIVSNSRQDAEAAREVSTAIDSMLNGNGNEGMAQQWRKGPTTLRIPYEIAMRGYFHLLDQFRAATGQAAMPTQVTMSGDNVATYVRPLPTAGRVGVMPQATVVDGDQLVAWFTADLAATNKSEDTDVSPIVTRAATFSRLELDARRTGSTAAYTKESGYAYGNAADSIYVELVSSVMAQLDAQAINGNGTAPNFTGMFNAAAQAGTTNAAVDTATTVSAAIHSLVDGIYCADSQDISLVMPAGAYAWLASIPYIAVGSRSETSLIEWIESRVGQVIVSGYAPAADTSDGILHSIVAKCGNRPQSFAWPMWDALEVVIDDTSDAGTRVAVQSYSHLVFAGAAQGRTDWRELIFREAVSA